MIPRPPVRPRQPGSASSQVADGYIIYIYIYIRSFGKLATLASRCPGRLFAYSLQNSFVFSRLAGIESLLLADFCRPSSVCSFLDVFHPAFRCTQRYVCTWILVQLWVPTIRVWKVVESESGPRTSDPSLRLIRSGLSEAHLRLFKSS